MDAFGSGGSGDPAEGAATNNRAPQLRDTAAKAADLDERHDSGSDWAAHATTTAQQQVEAPNESFGRWMGGEALRARWIAAVTAGRGEVPGGQGCRLRARH